MVQAGEREEGGGGGTECGHYFCAQKWLQETSKTNRGDHPRAMLGLWGQRTTKQMLLAPHGWLTDKAAGSQRVSRGTWVRSHKDRASKGSPESRLDHTSATINNVCSKVGGIERGPYWRRPTCPSNVKEKLVLCATQRRHCSQMLAHIHNQGCLWLLQKSLTVRDSEINFSTLIHINTRMNRLHRHMYENIFTYTRIYILIYVE